jgi:hypothetical protein
MRMQSYLVVTPQEERAAARFTRAFVHAAYRIGPESALLRRELLMQTRGGLLSLSDRDAPAVEDPEKLAAALVRECARREYAGAVLDFQAPPSPDRRALAAAAAAALLRSRRLLYLPESYACGVQGGAAVVNTAVSGGSLEQRLRAARDRWGSRAALDLQRLAMDFTLPSLSGEGAALTVMQLADLLRREAPAVFFSQDLGGPLLYLRRRRRGPFRPLRRRGDPGLQAAPGALPGLFRRVPPLSGDGGSAGAAFCRAVRGRPSRFPEQAAERTKKAPRHNDAVLPFADQ